MWQKNPVRQLGNGPMDLQVVETVNPADMADLVGPSGLSRAVGQSRRRNNVGHGWFGALLKLIVALVATGALVMSMSDRIASAISVPYSRIIQASGTQLYLYGSPYRFGGGTAYEVATEWGMNAGCGTELSDVQLNQLFASLPPNSLVRFWAFQGTIGTNYYTHQRVGDRSTGSSAPRLHTDRG